MAKRKRLGPAETAKSPFLETKSALPDDQTPALSVPIAQVAGDAAASAALAELSDQMAEARSKGRMVLELPLEVIEADYLVRDRLVIDPDEMYSLTESIRLRGQQTPIEVVDLGRGQYGLISGWRRFEALKTLAADGILRPALALLRCPQDVADAYLAMVEENEIRVGLSYYERAAIAAAAVDKGIFKSEKAALLHIYRSASRAKRSKIRSFLTIVQNVGGALSFPTAIGERFGLALAKALETTPEIGKELQAALLHTPPKTPEDEAKRINAVLGNFGKASLNKPKAPSSRPKPPARLPDGVRVKTHADGAVTLGGPGMTLALRTRLFDWLSEQK